MVAKIQKASKPKSETKNSYISQLKGLKDYVAIAVVDADKYEKTNLNIIKNLVGEGTPGVYVTLNKPHITVKKLFEREKINLNQVIFIDAVTNTVGGKVEKTDDCLFIGSPKNLSDISIAMDQAIMAIPKKDKFLFFDSLSTLLLYNDVSVVAKFVHFLSGKMRIWEVKGIIISLRRAKDKELIQELKEFCDVVLNL